MKFRMIRRCNFQADVAYEHVKSDHFNLTKRQLLAQILQQAE